MRACGLAATVWILAGAPALAQPDWQGGSLLNEVRAGVLAHDVRFAGGVEPGADINAELLLASPVPRSWGEALPDWMAWLARPRPNLGGNWNTGGATSQAYGGLSWTVPLGEAWTLDLDFGGAFNNGHVNPTTDNRKALGSNILFRLAAELGWHLTPRLGLFLLFEHVSNAGLASFNQSINDAGLRVGYRF